MSNMQFVTNSDYPTDNAPVRPVKRFEEFRIDQCDRYSTHILAGGKVVLAQIIAPRPQPIGQKTTAQHQREQQPGASSDDSDYKDDSDMDVDLPRREPDHAFWIQRTIRGAIYGTVYGGVVLIRSNTVKSSPDGSKIIWEAAESRCAIKEYNREDVNRRRGDAEDPFNEFSSMQYLAAHHKQLIQHKQGDRSNENQDIVQRSQEYMHQTNVMMPVGFFYDNTNLYTIMPLVDGGELFDVLEDRQRFSEPQARHVMHQILNGLETLQRAGICHRDMSLENVLCDKQGRVFIIDMGMCIKIPYIDDIKHKGQIVINNRERQRCFIKSEYCGKPYYISPEIRSSRHERRINTRFFDGHAIDVWALGPLLFLMVAGFPPFEIADPADERFRLFSDGFFTDIVRGWNVGFSEDLMDLLQRMFFIQPTDRLSLDQMRAHPWMQGEKTPLEF